MKILTNTESLLRNLDTIPVGVTKSLITEFRTALDAVDKRPEDLDPSLGFVEFRVASASMAGTNSEVGEVSH